MVDIFLKKKMQPNSNLFIMKFIHLQLGEKKVIDPCERSVFQPLEQYIEGENANPLFYCSTHKVHAAMFKKYFITMY